MTYFIRQPDHSFVERNKAGNLFRIRPLCAMNVFSREELLTLRQELGELLACEACGAIEEDHTDGLCGNCLRAERGVNL